MNKIIFIQGIAFKQFKDTKYYCDINGNIYSDFSRRILKPILRGAKNKQYYYIDINFGEGQKHYPIHKIVYETWIGELKSGQIVCHKNDNQLDNNINNLYAGNQKENIEDCINNNHRIGNTWILTVYDKKLKETKTFCPASNFIDYCGHPCANGGVKRMFGRNWFKQRYEIVDYYLCKDLKEKKGVTTIPDECKEVERNSSPFEAHDCNYITEEIV